MTSAHTDTSGQPIQTTPQAVAPQKDFLIVPFQGTKLEFVKFQIHNSVPSLLNDGEATLLAYLFLYPFVAKWKFIEDGHSKSDKSVDNYLSSLRKKGLVVGKGNSTAINPDLYLSESPENMIFTFSIQESKVKEQ